MSCNSYILYFCLRQDCSTDFEFLPIDVSFERCRRYYFQTGLTNTGGTMRTYINADAITGGNMFPTIMRATPTVVVLDDSGNTGAVFKIGGGTVSGVTVAVISQLAFNTISKIGGFATGTQDLYACNYKADAEL